MMENRKDKKEKDTILPTSTKLTAEEKSMFASLLPKIPGYQILSTLGEGGCGIVYLADQKEPVKRRVALKVIKPGMDSKQVIARFEAEEQALALLDHPNISQVFSAGITEAGRPYFVMEYVKGVPITEHCDRYKLKIEDRLDLFLQVCDAIQHAHQKGIIHRDIKPSNILVSIEGDIAILKVIDFGVAKAISQPLTEKTLFTEQGQLIGTPEYMSPEQAEMTAQGIDTRSDIYSLGVLLYELLTGALPFDEETLRKAAFGEIQRIIRQQDPPRPSARLSGLGEEATKVANSRQTEVKTLTKRLHKELEWIPLKAMRKEPNERYRSASEFADDIKNYIKGSPLIAGPESLVYQVKKFIKRNRILVSSVTIVLIAIVIGAIVSTIFAIRESRARVIADTERNRAIQAKQETEETNEKLLWENYTATLSNVQSRIDNKQVLLACELLQKSPVEHRGWEWGRLMRQSNPSLLKIRKDELDDRPIGSLHNAIFTPDEQYIIDDRPGYQFYSLVDLRTGKTIMKSKQYPGGGWRECTKFLPDEQYMSYSSGSHTVDIIEYKKDEMLARFDSGKGTLRSFVVSPNGKLAAGYNIVQETGQREIILWDIATKAELNRFQMESLNPANIHKTETETGWWASRLYAPVGIVLGFLPDNQEIIYVDEHLTILDIKTDRREHLTACRNWPVSYASKSNIAAIFNPSNQHIELWNVMEGVKVTDLAQPLPTGHHRVTISPDGMWVATVGSGTWSLWKGDTGEHIRTYITQGDNSITFSPSAKLVVTTDLEEIKVWSVLKERDVETKPFVASDNQLAGLSFDDDGSNGYPCRVHIYNHTVSRLVTGDGQGQISIWEVPSFHRLKQWQAHTQQFFNAAFSLNDKLLATSSLDGTAKVWETDTGKLLQTVTGKPGEVLRAVSLSNDGKRLAVGTDAQDTSKGWEESKFEVRVYDVETGQFLFTTDRDVFPISILAYSPNGKYLVVGRGLSPRYGHMHQGALNILDAETGQHSFGKISQINTTRFVSFSPDSRYFLVAGQFQAIILWDTVEQREVWRLPRIDAYEAVFHPDGQRFVAVRLGGDVTIHATQDGREMITVGRGEPPVTFLSGGRELIYRQGDSYMRLLHSDDWTLDKKAAFKSALLDVQQELRLSP